MTQTFPSARPNRFIARATKFLSGGHFPAFAIFALAFYQILIAILAFYPPTGGAWGEFLEDFRMRCFKLDPKSGWMETSTVWIMITEPLPLQAIFFFIWRTPLRELWRSRRPAFAHAAGAAFLLVNLLGAGLIGLGRVQAEPKERPFPAENLRSALTMPSFTLTNQDGRAVSLGDLKGRVVLVTAVYASCTTTCPMMLNKIRSVLDELTPEQRDDLSVVAFSLNPENDTRELREMTAKIYGLKSEFHFVNGIPGEINALLDQLNVARIRDEKTGQIMHSNLFFLLDRNGTIAYRLSLSQTESQWLISALRVLLAEKST